MELPEDFYYDAKTFARELPETELPASYAPLYHSFAFESNKRSNLHYLDEVRNTHRHASCTPLCSGRSCGDPSHLGVRCRRL